jgi:hypothetical protein
MNFAGVTKNVGKVQETITYRLSMVLLWFFILKRLIMIALDKCVPFFKYYFNDFYLFIFLYIKYTRKIAIVTSI